MSIHELLTKKQEIVKAATEIRDRVYNEQNGEWRGDDQKKFDELMASADTHTADLERLTRLEKAERSMDAAGNGNGRRTDPPPTEGQRATHPASLTKISDHDRSEAFRAWTLGGRPDQVRLTPEQRAMAARCGFDVTVKAIEIKLFSPKTLRSIHPEDIRHWEGETRAALTGAQSTTTTGGYTVADAAMRALEIALLQFGGMRQVATIIRTDTGGPLPFPTTNDTAQKGRLLGENTTAVETEMTFGQLVMDAYKYSSDYILASVEFLQDTSIDVGSFMGNALGTRIARLQNDHFTTGTGTAQPNGVITAATSGVASAGDPPTYDQLVDLLHSVDPAYRQNGRFMLADATLKSIKKMKVLQYSGDATGTPLWQPGMVAGQPDTILGYPFTVNQSMAGPGSAAKKIAFGDLSKYMIRDVRDVTLIRLDERFAEFHQVAFLAFARSDGDLLDAGTHPVKYLAQA